MLRDNVGCSWHLLIGLSSRQRGVKETQGDSDIASRLETNAVFINGYIASDARVPIGGIKKSGFRGELYHFGIREFCNMQTVWIDRR
ncbi:hypothetical protein ALQ17_04905 [Pseudomonas fluorescens]|nr:hypothetical protein ALQ17_04905 [Pseudomonas fluorescens]